MPAELVLTDWPDPARYDAVVIPAAGGAIVGPWAEAICILYPNAPSVVQWGYSPNSGALAGSSPVWPMNDVPWKALLVLPQEHPGCPEDLVAAANAMILNSIAVLGPLDVDSMQVLDGRFRVLLYPPMLP